MTDDSRDELDRLIDRALPRYLTASPMEGLEERVLQRIRVAGAGRRKAWFVRLAFGVPVLAGLVLVGIILRPEPVPYPTLPAPRYRAPDLRAFRPALQVPLPRRTAKAKRRVIALPKERRFPAPAPITDEERALVAWAGQAPRQATQVLADLRRQSDEPIVIRDIQIPPLRSDGTE
jgi:hypothetical protein